MTSVGLLIEWLLIVSIAGSVASVIVTRSYGFGVVGNIVVGILGSLLGGAVLPRLGLSTGGGPLGEIVSATAGAVLSLLLIGAGAGALLFLTGSLWRLCSVFALVIARTMNFD